MSKPSPSWRLFLSTLDDETIFYDGPVGTDGAGNTYPVDERGAAYFEIRLCHAGGTVYEVVDHPWRKRHLCAEFVLPLCWPNGNPYKTETFRVDLDVADRDVDWSSDYVAEAKLCDGRKVTVRMPMSAWREKDHVRVTRDPIVVDVAAISPPLPTAPPKDTTTTDALTEAAAAIESAGRALTDAARTAAAQRPRKATATRNDDGSLTVMYDSGGAA
jgi:hypothetical protein